MNRENAIEYLQTLPVEEFVAVLQQVFQNRQPAPEEATYCRNCFFLGTAWSDLESEKDEPTRWGPWTIESVAYPNQEFNVGLGPNYGLCQVGTCGACGIEVRSNVKQGLCPICGAEVYMT